MAPQPPSLSPSLPPTLAFPAPAVPPPHTQSRILLALGVCALGLEASLLLAAAGCVCVCVCACVCACAHASECSSVHVLPSVCYSWPVPTIALGPPRAMGIHTDTNTHTHTLREHTGAQAQRGQTQPHAETDTQGHRRTHTSPLTHTLLSTFSLAQIMYTFIDMPHSQPHSFTPGNMPSVSLSLHIYTQGQKIHHAYSKCHLLKFPQPAIRPSATPEGFPTRHPQGKT